MYLLREKYLLRKFFNKYKLHKPFYEAMQRDKNKIIKYCNYTHSNTFFGAAFSWAATKEGYYFWSNISKQYEKFYLNFYYNVKKLYEYK